MIALLCSAPLLLPSLPSQDTVRPGATALVEQARLFVPQYEGDHKRLLSPAEERDTRAAQNILEASLALDPESAYALWWHGQCCALLGENERNRGRRDAAEEHYRAALDSFAGAVDRSPEYYWAHYSRAMALANVGRFEEAFDSFEAAIRVTSGIIDAGQSDDWAPFVRFKARQWRADTRLRAFEFEQAREELVSFYADNGNNQWDLEYSLADAYLRESDLEAARATYTRVIENPEFEKYDSSYAELAYIAGLVDDRELAVQRMRQTLEKEFKPTLYPRLWLWILADGELRAKAAKDLGDFLEYPPADLSEWDRTLGQFVLGGEDSDGIGAFIEKAQAERERRMAAGEDLDSLMCEVWFYAGLWDERAGNVDEAMRAYRLALAFRPAKHKWEWSYARHRFAKLASERGLAARPGFSLEGQRLTVSEDGALNRPVSGELQRFTLHRAGASRPTAPEASAALDPATLQPGDLLRCTLRDDDGALHAVRIVVDA